MQASSPIIMEKKRAIKDWAKDDRPREKLIARGPQALSDSELLALLIPGSIWNNALEQARLILENSQDNLLELGKRTVRDLVKMKIKGFGETKATAVVAAIELGRRRQTALAQDRQVISDTKTAAAYLHPLLADYPHERFGVMYLDQSGGLKQFEILSQGGITATIVDPRVIFKKALEENAVSIIISHNHPSGNLQPSKADEILTKKIKEGASVLDIRLLDHIIVGDKGYFSFANEGLLA
jgi:DNA repair protein RadC